MKLDEKLWLKNRWGKLPNKERWYDGSFPTMREISQLGNEDLQQKYLDSIRENRLRGSKDGNEYFDGDATLCRIEMGRRIDEGLVSFDDREKSLRNMQNLSPKEKTSKLDLPLFIAIEEIDSFSKIAAVPSETISDMLPVKNSEAEIKRVILSAINEPYEKVDWGGEQNDILTFRVLLKGRRIITAFFLKGPSVKGRLTLRKCGKNGDQIQRLFQSPADLFIVQYNGEIDERVIEECRQKVKLLRTEGNANVLFSLMDGTQTARLLAAYRDNRT